jgi:hypothetical protein
MHGPSDLQSTGPADSCPGSRVQLAYLADLMTYLGLMNLIDAYLVNPDPLCEGVCQSAECAGGVVEALAYAEGS